MRLIVIHKTSSSVSDIGESVLRFGLANEPVTGVIFDELSNNASQDGASRTIIAVPQEWMNGSWAASRKIMQYSGDIVLSREHLKLAGQSSWFEISNGRFVSQIDSELLCRVLSYVQEDVVMLRVEQQLRGYSEKVLLTADDNVAGLHRIYSDCAQPVAPPDDWPHHVFVKSTVLNRIFIDGVLPLDFTAFMKSCSSNSLKLCCLGIGGISFDLDSEAGLIDLLEARFKCSSQNGGSKKRILDEHRKTISPGARVLGKVLFGDNVTVSRDAVIVGPAIVCDGATIAEKTVVRTSVIGPGVSLPANQYIYDRVLVDQRRTGGDRRPATEPKHRGKSGRIKPANARPSTIGGTRSGNCATDNFRSWPRFSYARCFKRIADICMALNLLLLFAPVFPVIALAIKLTSRGPVFFKDKRQGRYGKEFNCLKFRTMITGADKIQEKLRVLNQLDGPQFKMTDDPRIGRVGRFLRDTYIDEIPQFLNVLRGQMSVIGPRPSPEAENTTCPPWRDARLSVRPGISGLWQICRTREPMKDFQEWIHYDTKYVRDLSFRLDLWICLKTVRKMIKDFISQF